MNINALEPGDIIFAAVDIVNDGTMPGVEEDALIAKAGQRGVLVNTGHLEDQPDKVLLLVRFEHLLQTGNLGPAVACWPEELVAPTN